MTRKQLVILGLLVLIQIQVIVCTGGNGGIHPVDFKPESDDLDKQALEAALKKIGEKNEGLVYRGVDQCRVQVVAGKIYYLVLNFGTDLGKIVQFEFKIYLKPWENLVEVQEIKQLENSDETSSDLYKNLNLRDEILRYIESQVKLRVNTDLEDFIIKGFEVLEQRVVQGDIYKIVVNFEKKEQIKSFVVEIWSRPWLRPALEIISIKDYKVGTQDLPKTLRSEQPEGGFTKIEWNENGKIEKALLEEIQRHGSYENLQVIEILSKPMAVIHFRLRISFQNKGINLFASVFVTYNPRIDKAKIENFQILREGQEGVVGGFNEYKWDKEGATEKTILEQIHLYGATNFSQDFSVIEVISAKSKIVNGVIYRIQISYSVKGTVKNAVVDFYAQVWTNTFKVLDFQPQYHEL